ncbi:MAG: 2-amino-3,7-dideoxy-D-threo-hept-6-ulosonate synthase [Candidatus Bathyarchaeota archaeon]|nr:2-amino-3,7-dideoxy-D-threo-hept-6-ulosonate synthase [Candidatus Bathyarchaeota archaeon]
MNVGKTRRLKKIMQKDHRTVIVPMDHGITIGPVAGITNMQTITNQLVAGDADAILVHKGIAKCIDVDGAGLIVMLSAASNLGPNPNGKVQVCSVEEALRLGADAVSVHVNIGAQDEDKMLSNLGKVSEECEHYGLPLLAMMYPRGPKIQNEHDPQVVAHAARIGAELGADIIKTNFTGTIESFRAVTESCPAPVVIAGGPKCKSIEEVLQTTYDALQAGAAGLSIGRNIFQCDNPTRIAKALSAIVHEDVTVEQAKKIFGEKT